MATKLKNARLLHALLKKPVDRTPVWIMRQAGRYLPEYRELRKKAGSFLKLCKTPELACEVTLQPINRFDLDAAIIFSDILTIPDAMGLNLKFADGEGPYFENPIKTIDDIRNLSVPDPTEELGYVMQAISLVTSELDNSIPVIGFAGSPWTTATYMVEGSSSKDFLKIKKLLHEDPLALDLLLETLSKSITSYLDAQIASGANAWMLFDTWGGPLDTEEYKHFSLEPMRKILQGLKRNSNNADIPTIIFTKKGGKWLEIIAESGCSAISIDWETDIEKARKRVGTQVALQGNLDPSVLKEKDEVIKNAVEEILRGYGKGPGHIFNLGHGIGQEIDPDRVNTLVESVHALSAKYHS